VGPKTLANPRPTGVDKIVMHLPILERLILKGSRVIIIIELKEESILAIKACPN